VTGLDRLVIDGDGRIRLDPARPGRWLHRTVNTCAAGMLAGGCWVAFGHLGGPRCVGDWVALGLALAVVSVMAVLVAASTLRSPR
jgi:hypothetical protein